MQKTEEPKGVGFFSVKSGKTRYAKMEPQIQGYINSSDLGINASRGQDYGWRLAKEWVDMVKEFRRDATRMAILTSKVDGGQVGTVQILYAIYGEQVRNYRQAQQEEASPYEEQYLQDISSRKAPEAPAEVEETQAPQEPVTPAKPEAVGPKPKATTKK